MLSENVVVLLLSIGSTVVLSMAVIVVFVRFLLLSAIGLVTNFIVKLSSGTYASAVVTIVLTSVALKVIFAVLLSWTLFVFLGVVMVDMVVRRHVDAVGTYIEWRV